VLEQRNWAAAAQLDSRRPASFPWGQQHSAFESLIHYARAIGGARSGDLDVTRASIAELETMGVWVRENLSDPYWFSQVDVQLLAAGAWLAYAEGAVDEALDRMREAADIENATDKSGVTPGEVLPAGEMLGDMLVEQGQYAEALASYERVLSTSPNRFHSLYGAGHAAELSGDEELAGDYYRQLVEMAGNNSGRRDRLDRALAYLDAGDEAAGS
jgi:tetratricopeptide (TPR) repeat protein